MRAVEILVQAIVVTLAIAQQKRRRQMLTCRVASLQELRVVVRKTIFAAGLYSQ